MTKQLCLLTMQGSGDAFFMARNCIADLPPNSSIDPDFDVPGIAVRSTPPTVFYQTTSGKHGNSIMIAAAFTWLYGIK